MKYLNQSKFRSILALTLGAVLAATPQIHAASASQIKQSARTALRNLYAANPGARNLGAHAKAILVFPSIVKAGFMVGAQHGEGAMFSGGSTAGYYATTAASYGFQAGVQKFGYALFFMNDRDLAYLRKSGGWEIGSGPSVVIVDEGMASSMSTTTLRDGVYAFAFNQRGLMAGLGLQGSKITRIHPD